LLTKENDTIITDSLPVMEDFYTIQGEGFYQGHAAYFVRLGGCDVGCVWCDVKESWDASIHPLLPISEIVSRVQTGKGKIVVITGGEPVMYNLEKLTGALKDAGFRTHIETSGVYPLTGTWDWVCLSPKKFKKPDPSIFEKAHELKVIINHKSDIAWAEEFTKQLNSSCQLFLQPEWSKEKDMLPLIIDYVKENPKWQVSLQVHKYMNIP
jgi:7-carboxy-7-deazaguanine synthase